MRRTITTGLVTLAAVSALGAAPAAAADETGDPVGIQATAIEGRFWVHEWTNYEGNRKSYNTNDRYFGNDYWDGTRERLDGEVTSARNHTNRYAFLYQYGDSDGVYCSGLSVPFEPGQHRANLGNVKLGGRDINFNNKASCITFS